MINHKKEIRPNESSSWDTVVDEKTIMGKLVVVPDDLQGTPDNIQGAGWGRGLNCGILN
jgi:hypothetical protein